MKRVVIESPYAGDEEANKVYRQVVICHSIKQWEAPFASHQMYTDALNDDDLYQRLIGCGAGYTWMKIADLVAFYMDRGFSSGMKSALYKAVDYSLPIQFRWINGPVPATWPDDPLWVYGEALSWLK